MKMSGNQTAVKEIMNLLDPSFILPFMYNCSNGGSTKIHTYVPANMNMILNMMEIKLLNVIP
jgi:hypothetical protein